VFLFTGYPASQAALSEKFIWMNRVLAVAARLSFMAVWNWPMLIHEINRCQRATSTFRAGQASARDLGLVDRTDLMNGLISALEPWPA